jgi:hypothetical protein
MLHLLMTAVGTKRKLTGSFVYEDLRDTLLPGRAQAQNIPRRKTHHAYIPASFALRSHSTAAVRSSCAAGDGVVVRHL